MPDSRRLLSEAFLGEANIEVPDEWVAPLKAVVGSAARIRRLPPDSPGWIVDRGPMNRRAADRPARAASGTRPPPTAGAGPATSNRTGRSVPATNRFVQQAANGPVPSPRSRGVASGAPRERPADDAPDMFAPDPSHRRPGALGRAWSAVRGRDPETGLPRPKAAAAKAPGGGAPASGLPDLGRVPDRFHGAPGDPDAYRDPFPWMARPDGDGDDPKVAHVSKAFSKAKGHAPPSAKDDFEDDERTDVDAAPKGKRRESVRARPRLVEVFSGGGDLRMTAARGAATALRHALAIASESSLGGGDEAFARWCHQAEIAIGSGLSSRQDVVLPSNSSFGEAAGGARFNMNSSRMLREMFLREDDGVPSAYADDSDTQRSGQPQDPASPTSKPAGESAGLRVSGDKATLGALMEALQEAAAGAHDNADLADWCERAYKAVAMGMRRSDGGSVTLPPYEETPELDSFNDDPGIGPDEET